MWLQLSVQIGRSEFNNIFCSDFSPIWLVFGHVLFQRDETNSWKLLLLQSKELHNSLIVLNFSVDVHKLP
uniref:Ovule protein n=1 Tax=Meloidogyne incognita TaxID=6306 RepID=A0A914MWQ3_MELIC